MATTRKHTVLKLFATLALLYSPFQQQQANDQVFLKIGTEQGLSQLSVMATYMDDPCPGSE